MQRRLVIKSALAVAALGGIGAAAGLFSGSGTSVNAAIMTGAEALSPRVLGNDDAPVTIEEYFSLGCSHCAKFHRETLPELKTKYIETGKVKLVMRDYPLGDPAMVAAMITRCAPKERYFGMVELFLSSQRAWATQQDPIPAMKQIARVGGMTGEEVDACITNRELLLGIQAAAKKAEVERGVRGTPHFFIGDEEINGAYPFATFEEIIEKAL